MADRFPLVVDSSNNNIKELPDGDSLLLGDNEKLRFGDGQDLDIYHDGSHSRLLDNGSGKLQFGSDTGVEILTSNFATQIALFDTSQILLKENTSITGTFSATGVATASTSANITQVALADGSTSWDAAAAANAFLELTENTTIGQPSNAVEGAIISIEVAQHASSGPYTLAWNAIFEFASSTAPTMTATDAKTDIYAFRYNGAKWQEIGRVQNLAQS